MNYYLYIPITFLYIISLILIYYKQEFNKLPSWLPLFSIISCAFLNMIYFNTDAEDTYIALRYVKYFVNTGEWVFNSFDRVEGYSDFFWLYIIAVIHKVTHIEITSIARVVGLVFAIASLIYTYYLTLKISKSEFSASMAALLIAINGSFCCYSLSGLENPLFSFLLLAILHCLVIGCWWMIGLLTALLFMTRPEGFVIFFPLIFYILLEPFTLKSKFKRISILLLGSLLIIIPWMIWKYKFYGYFVPNSVAAKMGMDIQHQLKLGIKYTLNFLYTNQILVLIFSFLLFGIFNKRNNYFLILKKNNSLIFILFSCLIYFLFYTASGGDWMPASRFYSSIIPYIIIFLFILWHIQSKKISFRFKYDYNKFFIFFFILIGYLHIISNQDIYARVRAWDHQVNGLKDIGLWFKRSLPSNTLIATLPNGAFSYYNELPTLDVAGLTDNNTGRFGIKEKKGKPGHISTNWPYILNKKPLIIADMSGNGFESTINKNKIKDYNSVTFLFKNGNNRLGKYVNLYIRTDSVSSIISYLTNNNIELVNNEKSN